MQLSLSLTIKIAITFYSIHNIIGPVLSNPEEFKKVRIFKENILQFKSHEKNQERNYEFEIQWKYMKPSVSNGIRHDCGLNFLTPLILSEDTEVIKMKPKSVNCSFTKDKAVVNIVFF